MKSVRELLERYGQSVTVQYLDEKMDTVTRAFLQPMVERRENWVQEIPTPLGIMRQDRFLYLGDPDASLEDADQVRCGDRKYRVSTKELIHVGRQPSHWWAILVPDDGE